MTKHKYTNRKYIRRRYTRNKHTRNKHTRNKHTRNKHTRRKFKKNKKSSKRYKKKMNKRGGSAEAKINPVEMAAIPVDDATLKQCPECNKKSKLAFSKLDSHENGCKFKTIVVELDKSGLETGFDEQRKVFYIRKKEGEASSVPHTQHAPQVVPVFILEISEKTGIPVSDILGKPDGLQNALRVAELKELSPPREIEEVYDENGSLMYTVVEFNNKLFAAYEGEPDVFLTGVKYTDKVKWFKFSEIYDKAKQFMSASHPNTRQIFIGAASENTLDAWNRRGIPPILLKGDEENWSVDWDGCHRINSVMNAIKNKENKDIGIPVTFEDNNEWREPGPVYYSVNKSIFDEPDLLKLKGHLGTHSALSKDDPRVV
jgi:hypothetical protein